MNRNRDLASAAFEEKNKHVPIPPPFDPDIIPGLICLVSLGHNRNEEE